MPRRRMTELDKQSRRVDRAISRLHDRRGPLRVSKPKVGDFVLWGDDYFIISGVRRGYVILESITRREDENIPTDNLAPTEIKTWEVE